MINISTGEIMTQSEKNLKKIIVEMKENGTNEITHVVLKSQMPRRGWKKSLL